MFLDSHAHIDQGSFGAEVEAVLKRAWASGLCGVVTVGASGEAMAEAVALARRHAPRVRAAVGVHPHEADRATPAVYATLERLIASGDVAAVGETGLDFHYGFSSREGQVRAFETQVRIAREARLPLVIHCREAHEECFRILASARLPDPPGVIHCFTSGPQEARAWLNLGFMLSIPGVVTFKNAYPLHEAVRQLPLDVMLVETDSPYLAPVPMRGKRNEPAFVRYTVEALSRLKGLPVEEVARVTRRNAERLFGFTMPVDPPR